MAENVPSVEKEPDIQKTEVYRTAISDNQNKSTFKHITSQKFSKMMQY